MNVNFTKSDIAGIIKDATNCTKTAADEAANKIIAGMSEAIVSGRTVQLNGVGSIKPGSRAARTGRNPATGKPISIPAKRVAKFSTAGALDKALNA